MERIKQEKKRLVFRRRVLIFSAMGAVSLGGGTVSFSALKSSLIESGFLRYLSLIFSDFQTIVSLRSHFVLSLAETLPVARLTLFFVFILGAIISLAFLTKNIKPLFNLKKICLN